MSHRRLLLAMLGATALLCALAGTAPARNFSISSQTWRATWSALDVSESLGVTIRCQLTLEGSYHARTFAKVAGTLIGYVNRAALAGCQIFEGSRLLTEALPWHVRYRSFSGPLPNIASYATSIVGFAIQIRDSLGRTCLGTSTAAEPFILTWGGPVASGTIPATCLGASNPLSFGGRASSSQAGALTLI